MATKKPTKKKKPTMAQKKSAAKKLVKKARSYPTPLSRGATRTKQTATRSALLNRAKKKK